MLAIKLQLRKRARLAEMGNVGPMAQRMLEVLCHAAKADGAVDPRELAVIADIAEKVTGTRFAESQISRIIDLGEKSLQPAQFKKFGAGMSESQSDDLMLGAMMVLTADGEVSAPEQKFLNGLAGCLAISEVRFNVIVAEMHKQAVN